MSAVREVGVVVRRAKVDSPWIDHVWSPEAVLAEAPATLPGALLSREDDTELFYAGAATIELHKSETGNYRDNLIDGAPFLWVALRETAEGGVELAAVTPDPTEGESLFESGLLVGKAAMPAEIASWIAAYVDEFHVERVFLKRERDKSGPDPRKAPGARKGRKPGDSS
jgi:hypothetical protein